MQHYEKHNPQEVDKVDVVLKLFDGQHDELDAKLRHTHGFSHYLHDFALASDNANKLAINNKLFSSIRNKNYVQ